MSFRKKGAPLGALEGQSIRFFFRIYFEFWLVELNSENYINEIYKLELKQFVTTVTERQINHQNNSVFLEKLKENNFIKEELRCLQKINTWINKVFSFHYQSIDDIKEFKRRFEYRDNIYCNNENSTFIKKYRALLREKSKAELGTIFQQKFQDVSNEVLLYFLVIMYLDLLDTEDFLRSKYHSIEQESQLLQSSEQIKQDKNKNSGLNLKSLQKESNTRLKVHQSIAEKVKIFKTVWEAVLYYSVLVDMDPSKFRSKKYIPEVVEFMFKKDGEAISPHTFYQKLSKMNNVKKGIPDSKHGKYKSGDYQAVEERLKKESPEAVSILKANYYYRGLY